MNNMPLPFMALVTNGSVPAKDNSDVMCIVHWQVFMKWAFSGCQGRPVASRH